MLAAKLVHSTEQYTKQIRRKKGLDKQLTFLKVKSKTRNKLSMGIQMLVKGDDYMEPAHVNGEVYFVLKGNAKLRIGKKIFKASPGMALYVPSRVKHRFYDVKKEFVFLFIFAGADV